MMLANRSDTTDEELLLLEEAETIDDDNSGSNDTTPVKKKTAKTRKTDREHAQPTRRQKSRACKENHKSYEVEFSD